MILIEQLEILGSGLDHEEDEDLGHMINILLEAVCDWDETYSDLGSFEVAWKKSSRRILISYSHRCN